MKHEFVSVNKFSDNEVSKNLVRLCSRKCFDFF